MSQQTLLKRILFVRTHWYLGLCLFFIAFTFLNTFFTPAPKTEAAVSNTMNFQARLLQSSGALVPDGYYNVEFKLYDANTAGNLEWTETYKQTNRVRVANGYLTVNLGALTAFPNTISWDQEHWLTMNIGGTDNIASPAWDGEMTPRLKLTAVPYAFQAKSATQLQQTQGAYTGTLGFNALSANRTINAPDESGTICLQGSANCGFVAGSATNFIQNGTTPQTANFNVTGNGALGGALSVGGNLTLAGSNAAIINRTASANTNAILVARVSTDSQDKFRLEANGRMQWGNGTDALDTTLYRVGVNTLQTDGAFTTGGTLYAGGAGLSLTGVSGSVLKAYSTSGTVNQNDVVVLVNSSGAKVATSTTPRDTRIVGVYRGGSGSASGSVAIGGDSPVNVTAGVVNVGDQLVVSGEAGRAMVDNNATSGILGYAVSFKAAGSPGSVTVRLAVVNGNTNPYYQVNDYRIQNAAGSTDLLRIDGTNNRLAVGPAAVPANGILTVGTNTTNAANGIYFGTDVNLYRSGNDYLKTDDNFQIGGSQLNLLNNSARLTFGASSDVNLYRSAANTLATDDSFSLLGTSSNLTVQGTGTSTFDGALSVAGSATFGGNLTVNGSQFTNNASTVNTAGVLGNFPTGGAVGSATTTVDIKTTLAIAQTTAGQTLTLPNPTDTTAGRVMYVLNTGTTPFDMHGVNITNGYGQIYVWSGSAWILGASGGGSAISLQSAYDGGSSINTSNARDIAFNLTDTATDGNFLVNIASGSTGQFKIRNNGTDVLAMGATGQLALSVQGPSGGLMIGGDANLYRHAAGFLKTYGSFAADGNVYSGHGSANQIRLNNNGQIQFGSSQDTNLYRSGANLLATDDSFSLLGTSSNLTVQGTGTSSFAGSLTVGGTITATGNINTSGGDIQTGGISRLTVGGQLQNINQANLQAQSGQSADILLARDFGNETSLRIRSDGTLNVRNSVTSGKVVISTSQSSASYNTFEVTAGGTLKFGSGVGGPTDTSLYRSDVNQLATSGGLTVGGVLSGNGSGLTDLNGSNITTGTIDDARLSSNVALKNANNNFSTSQTVNGTVTATEFVGGGSGITDLNASNISSGTLNDARLSSNVVLLDKNSQTFTGNDQLFKNNTNSATALQIQNAGGNTLFNADTINQRINIGSATSSAKLTVSGDFASASTWTARSAAEANQWKSITYGNGMFVAVASTGTNRVMTSPNGITWTARSVSADTWNSVTYGSGQFVAVSSFGPVMTSPDGITWTARTTESNSWSSITYGNGMFVAVAQSGINRVMTSPNGITWTARTAAEANVWNSVTYGNGQFVAVGRNGTNLVMTSPDGITWTARSATENTAYWNSVIYAKGMFVAVSQNATNQVMTSPDGITWTARSLTGGFWQSVTYANGMFVTVANGGTGRVAESVDGITWTPRTAAEANSWSSVAYGNDLFVATSLDGTNRVMTSPGGYSKAMTANGDVDVNGTIRQNGYEVCTTAGNCKSGGTGDILQNGNALGTGMTIGTNDGFDLNFKTSNVTRLTISSTGVATFSGAVNATSFAGNGASLTSLNGGNISSGTINDARLSSNVALKNANNNFSTSQTVTGTVTATDFAGSGSGLTNLNASNVSSGTLSDARLSSNVVLLDRNSQTFTGNDQLFKNNTNSTTALAVQNATGDTLFNADTTNQRINIGTATGNAKLTVSGDFANASAWTARSATEAVYWSSVTYGNGMFVAVSSVDGTNRVMTSPDGITWTPRTVESNYWNSVTYGNGMFVAVAQSGTNRVMTSPDGITWTPRTAAQANTWKAVTYGNGLFSAVSWDGTNRVMTSPDGITWTPRTAAEANQWVSITYGNGLFVAASSSGTNRVMTSPDGITWTPRTAAEANQWQSVTYGNGLFVATSSDGTNRVMTSPDGITWTPRTAAQANQWNSITYGNGLFVAVASTGTNRVMTSPDGITWTPRTAAEANQWRSVTYGKGLFVAIAESGTNRVMTSPGGYSKAMNVLGDMDISGAIRSNGYEVCTTAGNCKSGISTEGVAMLNANNQIFFGNNQIFRNGTNGTSAFQVQNSTNGNVLNVDTTNTRVTIGTASAPSLAGANLVVTNAEVQTAIRIGNGTNGVDISGSGGISYSGTARKTKKITLTPEYAGAVLDGSGLGAMTAGHDGTRRENYYKWTSTSGSWQEYNVVITMPVPSDWSAWAASNALSINTYSSGAANAGTDVTVIGTAGVTDVNLGAATPASGWSTYNFNLTDIRYTADGMMTVKLRVGSQSSGVAQVGNITLTYLSKF